MLPFHAYVKASRLRLHQLSSRLRLPHGLEIFSLRLPTIDAHLAMATCVTLCSSTQCTIHTYPRTITDSNGSPASWLGIHDCRTLFLRGVIHPLLAAYVVPVTTGCGAVKSALPCIHKQGDYDSYPTAGLVIRH